jgi:hypothetical protein
MVTTQRLVTDSTSRNVDDLEISRSDKRIAQSEQTIEILEQTDHSCQSKQQETG